MDIPLDSFLSLSIFIFDEENGKLSWRSCFVLMKNGPHFTFTTFFLHYLSSFSSRRRLEDSNLRFKDFKHLTLTEIAN